MDSGALRTSDKANLAASGHGLRSSGALRRSGQLHLSGLGASGGLLRSGTTTHSTATKLRLANKKAMVAFLIVLSAAMFLNAAYSLLSTFLPVEALARGATPIAVAMVFSAYSATVLFGSPVAGYFGRFMSAKTMIVMGLGIMAAAVLSMTSLSLLHGWEFLAVGIGLRIVQGVGGAFVETGVLTAVVRLFPDEDAMAAGIGKVEMASGIGFIVGPVIGGWSFQLGGFTCPFLVCGGMLTLIALGTACTLDSERPEPSEEPVNWGRLLRPGLIAMFFVMMFAYASTAFLDPVLSPFLINTFGLNVGQVGLVFAGLCIVYSFCAPFAGWVVTKLPPLWVMVFGDIIMAGSFWLIGPPFHVLPELFVVCVAGLTLMNIGLAFSLVIAMEEFVLEAVARGCPEEFVSGIVPSALSMAEIVGPLLGSTVVQEMSFDYACLTFSGGLALCAVITSALAFKRTANRGRRGSETDASLAPESKPLLAAA